MGRVLAIDYGLKRTGLAVTDPLKMIANPLETVPTHTILDYLKDYAGREEVETFVLGMPKDLQNRDTDVTSEVKGFRRKLEKNFPGISVVLVDERFTSKMAFQAMLAGGMKKKERSKKENIDKISATIILQSYLEQKR